MTVDTSSNDISAAVRFRGSCCGVECLRWKRWRFLEWVRENRRFSEGGGGGTVKCVRAVIRRLNWTGLVDAGGVWGVSGQGQRNEGVMPTSSFSLRDW